MSNEDSLQRLQALLKEKEMNILDQQIAELVNQLYEMDIEAAEFDVSHNTKSQEEADIYLAAKRKKYFG